MAKRFISTELFDDGWFMDLSMSGKILWVYIITKCDHAGMIKLNEKLCRIQTGLNDVQRGLTELSSRVYHLTESHLFIPKFLDFQYPDFPNSKVNQQKGAISILERYGLLKDGILTVSTSLNVVQRRSTPYIYDNGNDNEGKGGEGEKPYRKFRHLTLSVKEFESLRTKYTKEQIDEILDSIENYRKNKDYTSLYFTAAKWLKKEYPQQMPQNKSGDFKPPKVQATP